MLVRDVISGALRDGAARPNCVRRLAVHARFDDHAIIGAHVCATAHACAACRRRCTAHCLRLGFHGLGGASIRAAACALAAHLRQRPAHAQRRALAFAPGLTSPLSPARPSVGQVSRRTSAAAGARVGFGFIFLEHHVDSASSIPACRRSDSLRPHGVDAERTEVLHRSPSLQLVFRHQILGVTDVH